MSTPNNPDLVKAELKEIPDLSRHIFEVELLKDPEVGLGFNIIGGIDEPHIPGHTGIFISKIRPNGPAAKDGRLRPGDRIFSVNDISLTLKTHSEAVEIFKQTSGKVRLVVEQDAETLILSQPSSVFLTPVTDSPVQESLRLSILKSASSKTAISPVASPTSLQPADIIMTATVAVPPQALPPQAEKPKLESDSPQLSENGKLSPTDNVTVTTKPANEVAAAIQKPEVHLINQKSPVENGTKTQKPAIEVTAENHKSPAENGTAIIDKSATEKGTTVSEKSANDNSDIQRTRRQSFREPLVTNPPSEAEQKSQTETSPKEIPSVIYSSPPNDEEEDRASTISVAPSVYSVIDDVPKTPKKPTSIFDPSK
jgi:hypothetical protein